MNNTNTPTPTTSSRKHKGRRHPLSEEEKHTVCKRVYYTPEQAQAIEAAADATRISDSKYINEMSTEGKVVAPISPDFARDFRAVANLSNNLNQLAHRANAAGYQTVASEMLIELPRIRGVLDIIYESI